MKLDILVIGAHPDDAEIGCGGTIAKHVSLGKKVGILDLTAGELGTRGTPELRAQEAQDAAAILGVTVRENLGFRDGFFREDEEHQLRLIAALRKFRPEIVLAAAIRDRHPDHGRTARLADDAFFLSGLNKIRTVGEDGAAQESWRPRQLFHYVQALPLTPDFIVDVSGFWDQKIRAVKAFRSQMYDPKSTEPETYISKPAFLEMIEARCVDLGHLIGCSHGEGFTCRRTLGIERLDHLV